MKEIVIEWERCFRFFYRGCIINTWMENVLKIGDLEAFDAFVDMIMKCLKFTK